MKAPLRHLHTLVTDPRYFVKMAAVKLRTHYPLDFRLFKNGYAMPPAHLSVEVTHRCNLSCHICDLFGRKDPIDSIRSRRGQGNDYLSPALMARLCDSFGARKPVISLGGGEPLLHPQIVELVRLAKGAGHVCTITSNGVLLERTAPALVEAGLDSLVLSIDGPEEVHDETRGVKGTYARARAGARALLESRRAGGAANPRIRINCTINSRNFAILSEMVAVAEEIGADSIVFSHLWFWDRKTVEAHNRTVGDLCRAVEQNTYELELIRPEIINREIAGIKGMRSRVGVKFLPDLSEADTLKYYSEPNVPVKRFSCRAAWLTAFVMPDGEVIPCLDYHYGNIGELPFGRIWNGQRARAFRRRLRGSGIFPACVRCCGLYAF